MLRVTESAKQLLGKTLREHTSDPETGIRLLVKEGGQLGIILDSESEGDHVVEHDGDKVLLVAPAIASALEGSKLDIQDTESGRKLIAIKDNQADNEPRVTED